MKRIIYIAFLILLTGNLLAQGDYVIDSLCIGHDRTYAVNGDSASTYRWFLEDTLTGLPSSVTFADTSGIDFMEGDTIYGSENSVFWDITGIFRVTIFQYSWFGCDTVEYGLVKVFDPPEVFAGNDTSICTGADVTLASDWALHYSTLTWTTLGDGSFDFDDQLHPTYSMGAADSATGSVTLVLRAEGLADNGTCEPAIDSMTIFYAEPVFELTAFEVLCYGDNSGKITVYVPNHIPSFSYYWTGPNGFTSSNTDSITNLYAGMYYLTIIDAIGCSTTDSIYVDEPPELLASIDNIQHVSCYNGTNGYILASATGGVGNYEYNWVSGSGDTLRGNFIYDLPADMYYLEVRDSNQCIAIDSVEILQPEPVIATIDSVRHLLCYGDANGYAAASIIGGTAPYEYSWITSSGLTSTDTFLDGLSGDTLYLTITDAQGCEHRDTAIVHEPEPLIAGVDTISDVLCFGDSTGFVVASASGGTAPYYFDWETPWGETIASIALTGDNDSLVNLPAGTYYLTVTDTNGCFIRDTAIVEEPLELIAGVDTVGHVFCYDGNDGLIYASASGGVGGYTFQWITASGDTLTGDTLEFLQADTFYLSVKDANDCEVLDTAIIEQPEPVIASIDSVAHNLCYGDSMGYAQAFIVGGTAPYTFIWETSSGTTYTTPSTFNTTDTLWNLPADTLYLTVIDAQGCDFRDTSIIYQPEPLELMIDSIGDVLCFGDSTGYVYTHAVGGTAPYYFNWTSASGLTHFDSIWNGLPADTLYLYLEDTNGCPAYDTVIITQPELLLAEIIPDTIQLCDGETASLEALVSGGTTPYQHNWSGPGAIMLSRTDTSLTSIEYPALGDYMLYYLVQDSNFCEATDSVFIQIYESPKDTIIEYVCINELPFTWYGRDLDSAGYYNELIPGPAGCDTLRTLELFIDPLVHDSIQMFLCENELPYNWNGIWLTGEGFYNDTIAEIAGLSCDTVRILELFVDPPVRDTIQDMVCDNQLPYIWRNNIEIYDAGTYTDTTAGMIGCDTIFVLELYIEPPVQDTVEFTICDTELPYVWRGMDIPAAGTWFDTTPGIIGTSCDTVHVLNLDVIPPFRDTTEMLICEGDEPFDWKGQTVDTYLNNLYTAAYKNNYGCDSILYLDVRIVPQIVLDTTIVHVSATGENDGSVTVQITGGTGNYSFNWSNGAGTRDLSNLSEGTYTLFVTDDAGCEASIEVTLIAEIQKPYIACPGDTILDCFEDIPNYPKANTYDEFIAYGGFASSDCGIDVSTFTSKDSTVFGENCYEIQRTYSVTDSCGETLSCVHFIIVNDKEDPVITGPGNLTGIIGTPPPPYTNYADFTADLYYATDNCGIIEASFRVTQTTTGSSPKITTRVYEIDDYCGNTGSWTQTIEYLPNDTFELSCPPDISNLECFYEEPARYSSLEEFEAAGGIVNSPFELDSSSFDMISETRTSENCLTITRIYSISDINGNTASCTHVITIQDLEKPTAIFPDKTVECNIGMPPVYTTVQQATADGNIILDNCGLAYLSIELIQRGSAGTCPTTYTRRYRITDGCGNFTEVVQTIISNDTEPPILISTPSDLTADCIIPDRYRSLQEFQDDGGDVMDECRFRYMVWDNDTPDPNQSNVINRTYLFFDYCDNWTPWVQRIVLNDTTPPLFIDMPDPLIVDCYPVVFESLEEYFGLGGSFDENCELDSSTFRLVSSVGSDSLCPKTYVNTYEIYDASGNRGTATHTVIVVDNEAPVLVSCIPDDTISYEDPWPKPFETLAEFEAAGGLYTDNCGIDTFALVALDSVITDCYSSYTYSYQVADICRNWSEICSFTIVKQDTVFPELYCPADTFITCVEDLPDPFTSITEFKMAGGFLMDNYRIDSASFKHVGDNLLAPACPLIIERTYQITDGCGNTTACSHIITVDDTNPPTILCMADTAIECLSDVPNSITTIEEFLAAGGELYDNCGLDSASFTAITDEYVQQNLRRIRTVFSIADLCGNINSCARVITLTDTIPPVPNCDSMIVLLADSTGSYTLSEDDIRAISAGSWDNCTAEADLIIDVSTETFDCFDISSIHEITVTVTDEAGNSSTCITFVTVEDIFAPVAMCRDITVYLDENGEVQIATADIDNGSWDNCEIDTMFLDKYMFDCTEVYDNLVRLTVVDSSGNSSECTATVTVLDTISPDVMCRDFEVQLGPDGTYTLTTAEVAIGAYDECGIDTTYLDQYLLDCSNIGTTLITVTTVDVNGNTGNCVAELTVYGNTPPNVQNDSAVTAMNTPIAINVVDNDYDVKTTIDVNSMLISAQPANGTVSIDQNSGELFYTPNPGFVGIDILTYDICDDGIPCVPMCGTALVHITVLEPNNPPIAENDYYEATCANINGDLLINDSDPDGDAIRVEILPVEQPAYGVVTIFADGTFEYIPPDDYFGLDSFRYEIIDDGLPNLRDTATVFIEIFPDNDCDGIIDAIDIDDDNDGILDVVEGDRMVDSDLDGIPDSLDIDSDNDGILDNEEGQEEGNFIAPIGKDENNNGWDDAYDPPMGGYEFVPADTDGDGTPDYLDLDSDNDHVYDFIEGHDINADGIPDVTRIFVDSDRDGLDDIYDTVYGWRGGHDVVNPRGSNSPLQDFDGDGTRDWRDTNDEDDEYYTEFEDLNNDGDYSNDDLDLDGHPEYLDKTLDCELFIPEGFSPNGDGVHDFFQILCIQRYPNAKLMIFNRNGNLLWEKEHYGNLDVWGSNEEAWWWGTSDTRWSSGTVGSLPQSNYVYVLVLGNGEIKKGTVMVAY